MRYVFTVGCHSRHFYADTDDHAVAVFDRWMRLAWPRYLQYLADRHPGSIATATAFGWYKPTEGVLVETPLDSIGIIRCVEARVVERLQFQGCNAG